MVKTSSDYTRAEQWAEQEFGGADLGDWRLNRRLIRIAACFLRQPTASIPKACGPWSATKAAYRFFSNPGLKSHDVIASHQQQTQSRIVGHARVLVIQDTTGLNYGQRAGLGLVGKGPDGAKGLWLHSSMAFSLAGNALGLVQVQPWQRSAEEFGKARQRHQRSITDKESHRWIKSFEACVELAQGVPDTELINVADREGDIYELFKHAAAHPEVGVLVRARHNRPTSEGSMDEVIKATAVAGMIDVAVPRRPGKKARTAQLEVRYQRVSIYRAGSKKEPLALWVVDAREPGSKPQAIHWRLIINREIKDLAQAHECIRMYALRWQIEEYHRVLKSGCQTEGRQLESAEALVKVLMIDMVVAWRVLELNRLARSSPEGAAVEHFSGQELQLLQACASPKDPKPMTLRQAVRAVAQMGGFLARASDGEPGAMTLWRGLETLTNMLRGWELAKTCG